MKVCLVSPGGQKAWRRSPAQSFFFFFFCGSLCEKIGQVENIRIKLRDRKSKGGGESAVE